MIPLPNSSFLLLPSCAAPLALEFNENEKKNIGRQFQRVLAELRRLADAHEPHRSHCAAMA